MSIENPPAFPWLVKLLKYHETGGHEGDGSDHALRMARAELDGFPLSEKRDYFAGQALSSIGCVEGYADLPALAADCYRVADAMLAARQKGTPDE